MTRGSGGPTSVGFLAFLARKGHNPATMRAAWRDYGVAALVRIMALGLPIRARLTAKGTQ